MNTNSEGGLPLRKPDYSFSRAKFSPAQNEAFSTIADILRYRLVGFLIDRGEGHADYESCVTDSGLRFLCFVMDSDLCTIFGFPIGSEIAMTSGENSDIGFNENLMNQMQNRPAAELERIADELKNRPDALIQFSQSAVSKKRQGRKAFIALEKIDLRKLQDKAVTEIKNIGVELEGYRVRFDLIKCSKPNADFKAMLGRCDRGLCHR